MLKIKSNSVTFSDGEINVDLPFLWLRDNCQCDECRITETQE
ncbi:MAG: gamma-butyrobetaine hydroxylase, partial [Porticoccaceae bacterium]|nr:gamma-butyrobetaine hydroxylase [Porticoccaceae bacterium]